MNGWIRWLAETNQSARPLFLSPQFLFLLRFFLLFAFFSFSSPLLFVLVPFNFRFSTLTRLSHSLLQIYLRKMGSENPSNPLWTTQSGEQILTPPPPSPSHQLTFSSSTSPGKPPSPPRGELRLSDSLLSPPRASQDHQARRMAPLRH